MFDFLRGIDFDISRVHWTPLFINLLIALSPYLLIMLYIAIVDYKEYPAKHNGKKPIFFPLFYLITVFQIYRGSWRNLKSDLDDLVHKRTTLWWMIKGWF